MMPLVVTEVNMISLTECVLQMPYHSASDFLDNENT